jgi:hypothetical protein
MLRALLQRGIDDGTFRGDLSVTELLFLHGAQRRQDETADEGEGRPVS